MAYELITKYTSPNQSSRGNYGYPDKPSGVAHHWWGLPSWNQTFEGVINYLCTTRGAASTSAHYVISGKRVACIVAPGRAAWHAGSNFGNGALIGLEIDPKLPPGTLDTVMELCADLERAYGNLNHYGHRDLTPTECPGVIYAKIGDIIDGVNRILAGTTKPSTPAGSLKPTVPARTQPLVQFERLPVNDAVSQKFGSNPTKDLPASHPLIKEYGNYQPEGHDAIDFASPMGTPIYAPGIGTLDFAGYGTDMPRNITDKWGFFTDPKQNWGGGILTLIDHGTFGTLYAHMSRSDWDNKVGQRVPTGALLGLTGNTGRSSGPHLHWGVVVFPVDYLDPLYSRRNPFDYVIGEWFDKVQGGTGATSTPKPKEDTLSAAEVKQINDYTAALLLNGYTSGGEQKPSLRAILSENQRRITASNADIGALRSVVDQIAKSQGVAIDYAKVEEAAATGAARALASGVDIEATVTLNADTAKESKS